MHFMFYDIINTATFIGFPGRVRRRFGPVLMFPDDASWRKAKAVQRYVAGCGDMRPEYLPPHAPELNPIETEWRTMRDAMGSRVYGDTSGMVRSVRAMIRSRTIVPVKMSDYLTC